MSSIDGLSTATRLNAVGLVATAAGMIMQVVGGSTLYPSFAGPVVLLGTAAAVTVRRGRWTALLGLAVPVVLAIGAGVAAAASGGFVGQLTDTARPALLAGSVLHVAGLAAAIAGGLGVVLGRRVEGRR